jgi:hypothetical protein
MHSQHATATQVATGEAQAVEMARLTHQPCLCHSQWRSGHLVDPRGLGPCDLPRRRLAAGSWNRRRWRWRGRVGDRLRRRRRRSRLRASREQSRRNHDGNQRGITQLPEANRFSGKVGHLFLSSTVERRIPYDNLKAIDSNDKLRRTFPPAQKIGFDRRNPPWVGSSMARHTEGPSMRISPLLPREATSFWSARSF